VDEEKKKNGPPQQKRRLSVVSTEPSGMCAARVVPKSHYG